MRPQNAMIDMLHTRICVLNTWYFTGHTGLVGKWMYYGWWSAHPKISSTWDPYYSLFTPKSCWIRVQFSDFPSMGFCCSIGSTSITLTSQRSSNLDYDDPMILDYQDFFSARWSAHATRNNHQFRSCSRMLPLQRRDFRRKQEGDHLCRGVEEFVEDHTSPGSGRYGQVGQALRSPRLRVKGIV